MKDMIAFVVVAAVVAVALFINRYISKREERNMPADAPKEKPINIGMLLLIGGMGLAGYAFLFFDVTIDTTMGRIVNLSLMDERRNMILIGAAVAIVGAILMRRRHVAE